MWRNIRLTSLGVIEEAELELSSGFTVITGETGAGKTMVVTALGLLRGERADLGLVRHGAVQARVEAAVDVPEGSALEGIVTEAGGVVEDGELLLGRVLSAQGRSRAFVGGSGVPATVLSAVSDQLVAVHGQSDQHRLLRAAEQRSALDQLAGAEFSEILDEFAPAFARLREVDRRVEELRIHAQERARELDLLNFGLDEIAALEPREDEDATLLAEEGKLAHAEALVMAAQRGHDALAGDDTETEGARSLVAAALAALESVHGHDAELDDLTVRANEVGILLDELGGELGSYASRVELDPARLAVVQERRAGLGGLLRKYGPTMDDVFAWQEKSSSRLAELSNDDSLIDELTDEREQLAPAVLDLARRMSAIRTDAAQKLSKLVTAELAALSMPHALLEVQVTAREDNRLTPHGLDDVEFLFAANNGMQARPLSKGASGGELSRLMLALEVVLVDQKTVPTLVFDEVDAGIGGKAAVEVGRRLGRLAQHAQVLAVTHLPQVAAFADHHFHVQKDDDGFVTSSSVVALEGDARVDELARMLAGQEDSATAQAHARELLDLARNSR
ncbi:MAG: DNA repair protein RecN [Actinomycetota bacterium]|nr:DNA repair protein RecN [Actinomycetota bacterium]